MWNFDQSGPHHDAVSAERSLTITIVSREWWLAIEMLVLLAAILVGVMFFWLRRQEQSTAK